jgi:hypothetical protein
MEMNVITVRRQTGLTIIQLMVLLMVVGVVVSALVKHFTA